MTLVETLISEPSDAITKRLFEDNAEVFWVDWREDDSILAEYCESIIKSKKLSSAWSDDKLIIQYGEKTKEVPLTLSGADRHITLVAINEAIAPDYEIRMAWDSDGGDTLAFTILPVRNWKDFESRYGAAKVDKAFLKLTPNLNTFTDSLHGHRPNEKPSRKWWRFWL